MHALQQGQHLGGAAPSEQQTLWVDNALRVPFDPHYQMQCIRAQLSHACQLVITCLDPGRGWTITRGGWNFLKKQECWEGHERALTTLYNYSERDKTNRRVGGSWIQITNVGSITSTAADQ